MGTGNFYFEHRCVVVTDDDFEMGNVPERGLCVDHDRSFPSYVIKEFNFWNVVLTTAYYEGACIDYREHHKRDPYDVVVGYIGYPTTKKELFEEVRNEFNISYRQLQKICGNVGDMPIDDYIEQATEEIGEYLSEKEEDEVNEYIDKLKDEYGYEEFCCLGHFSNGEAVYQKIGA